MRGNDGQYVELPTTTSHDKSTASTMRQLMVFLFFFLSGQLLLAQVATTRLSEQSIVDLRSSLVKKTSATQKLLPSAYSLFINAKPSNSISSVVNAQPLAATPVPAAWRYQDLAFFCKLEVKMEKALKMPVKFRLGEVQYVEKMEGKLKSY